MNGSQRRHAPIPMPIEEKMTEERLSKAKGIIYKRQRVLKKETTTDAYAETESLVFDARLYKNVLIQVVNKHASNSITFKVLACIDPKDWSTLEEAGVSEFAVAGTKDKVLNFTVAWAYVKVQVKTTTSPDHGTVNAYIAGMTP